MTFMYEPGLRTAPVPACQGRCAACIADALKESTGPHNYWYRLWESRVPTCRKCHRHEGCPGATSCARQCTTPPDQIIPANRKHHIILPDHPMTPIPANR